jgi:hypothetical protein
MALARYWVSIPFLLECGAIFVQGVKEEKMDQPKMVWVGSVQSMHPLKSIKKGSPAACKLGAHFYPKPLDAGIVSRSVAKPVSD